MGKESKADIIDVLYKSRTRDMRNTLTVGDPGSSDQREIKLGELQGLPMPGLWGMESPLHTVRNQEVLDFLLDFKKGDEHEDSFRDMISSRDARGFNVLRARLDICKKIYTTQISGKRILHTENT